MTLNDILSELDRREYEEFALRARYSIYQEEDVYGDQQEEPDDYTVS